MSDVLLHEYKYYLAHQAELVEQYDGKIIVIKDGTVLGAYDSYEDALAETTKDHELGTFLLQKCQPELEVWTFHSRVAFAR